MGVTLPLGPTFPHSAVSSCWSDRWIYFLVFLKGLKQGSLSKPWNLLGILRKMLIASSQADPLFSYIDSCKAGLAEVSVPVHTHLRNLCEPPLPGI